MSASERERLADTQPLADRLAGLADELAPALTPAEQATLVRAATALRCEAETEDAVHPAAVRALRAERHLIIGADNAPRDSDAHHLLKDAYQSCERALAAVAAMEVDG